MLLVCSRAKSTTIHPRTGVRVSPLASDIDVSIPASLQREAPESASAKPSVLTRALPSMAHSISDGSPTADQSAAAATGARAFATVVGTVSAPFRSEEHTSELQSLRHLVCRLLLEKKKK